VNQIIGFANCVDFTIVEPKEWDPVSTEVVGQRKLQPQKLVA